MFVETHKSSYKGKDTFYVRLRMSYLASGKVLKKTIERIGSAPAGPELKRLQQAASQRKRQLEEAAQPAPLVGLPETVLTASFEARCEPPVTGTIKDFAPLTALIRTRSD